MSAPVVEICASCGSTGAHFNGCLELERETIQRVWRILDPQHKFASLEDAARNVMQAVVMFKEVAE